jgi:trans-4-hydroxy-L-proline dehydratase
MNTRIQKLREASENAVPRISAERAEIITDFYAEAATAKLSIAEQRAESLFRILGQKQLYLGKDELIVGERGPQPAAVPTYPEINLHSPQDLETLDTRDKVWFRVSDEVKTIYKNKIIPFWKGKTNRERIFRELDDDWKAAYEAGIFTEFLEQRAPGHTVLGKRMFETGFWDLKNEIRESISKLDFYKDDQAFAKKEQLRAMSRACDAVINYAHRYVLLLEKEAAECENSSRKKELQKMAAVCRNVPADAPKIFHEALQHYWFIHIGVISELNPWDSFNPGRLDQNLIRFYRDDLAAGRISKEEAKELLAAFWVKFNNHPAPPKVGITAKESSTYTDFALINLGGLTPEGRDGVNELTYLILDVIEEMRLLQPSSMIQVSKKNPDRFIRRTADIIKTGFGQPSIFNTDAIIQELLNQGKSLQDARMGGASGCVETGAFGNESYILTGYFNLPKILELTLNNGTDTQSGKQLGPKTGEFTKFNDFKALMQAFKKQLEHFIDTKIKGNRIIEQIWARYLPAPFMSLLINDCISTGKDYNAGGARYNTSYIQGVGLGTVTDSLSALKHIVFENRKISPKDLLNALDTDFKNLEELQYKLIYETPKYGNDDDEADQHAVSVFNLFHDAVNGRPNTKGGHFRINMLPTTSHVYFGSVTGALPDGRNAHKPLSEGISPVQGADRNGPAAVTASAAKIDHLKTGGTLLNQKFTPDLLKTEKGLTALVKLVRYYFRLDGHHIQFNVVKAETLRKAQKEPEKYRNLIVRVAGYSDYFKDLSPELQNEIIERTEHEGM